MFIYIHIGSLSWGNFKIFDWIPQINYDVDLGKSKWLILENYFVPCLVIHKCKIISNTMVNEYDSKEEKIDTMENENEESKNKYVDLVEYLNSNYYKILENYRKK